MTSLLGGIGYFLLTYAVPLVDKAHKVADEALDITSLARDKIEGIDKQVGDFLKGVNEKLEQVGDAASAVQALTVRLHTVIDQLNATNTELRGQLEQTPPPVDGTTVEAEIPGR